MYLDKDYKKFSLVSSTGIIANFLLHHDYISRDEFDGEIVETVMKSADEDENIILTFAFGMGVDWRVSNDFKLMMIPTFQHDITPLVRNTSMKTYLWDFGLNFGCSYNF